MIHNYLSGAVILMRLFAGNHGNYAIMPRLLAFAGLYKNAFSYHTFGPNHVD
jgi:hypothetical protein